MGSAVLDVRTVSEKNVLKRSRAAEKLSVRGRASGFKMRVDQVYFPVRLKILVYRALVSQSCYK